MNTENKSNPVALAAGSVEWSRGFEQGFSCAVSALIQGHGRSTESEELFRMIGDLSVVDEHDRKVFRECGLLCECGERAATSGLCSECFLERPPHQGSILRPLNDQAVRREASDTATG